MSRFARPETVLKRAEELIGVGQPQAALQALYDVFTSRRFKQTQLTTLEPIMLKFTELCVELRRGRTAKDGLLQYKNVSQNQNPASIELVIKHFIKLSEDKVLKAQEKADAAANELDVDDLEESETPESMLLGAVTSEENRDRTDRALVTPWLKFLWESYRTALDILRNNARLEVPYQQVAHQALRFCLQYQRKTEFRRLCDLLRTHLANVARYSHHSHAINIAEPDTLQRHLDTRFAQLNAAVELELWQEAFRSVEDVHNLLTMAKKAPKPAMMANYYEKLTKIFMVSDNNLFHAASWNRFYALARGSIKTEEEHTRMASFVLLSALAVPVISSSAPGTGNMNKFKSDFLLADQETRSRTGRLTSLLGLSRTPTRAGLLKEALNRNILKRVKPQLRELYNILEVEFHPLSICAKIEPIISQIAQDEEMAKYVQPLHSVILTRLFQQLSQVYDSVKLDKVMELVSAFKAPYNYSSVEIEKFVLNACKKGHLNIRVDHVEQAITFQDDPFEAKFHPAALGSSSSGSFGGGSSSSSAVAASIETDAVRLQQTPSELVRTQLSRLASCLDTTLKTIDPSILLAAQEAKRDTFARAIEVAEQEHKAAVARKAILARRKELLEERAAVRDREEAEAKAERLRYQAQAEQTRMAEEQRKRELDRVKKEMEAVRIEEARKLAQNLKERGGLKLTDEEFANLDTDKLVQLQVEQLEKEKRELAERLRVVHRRMDHMERAYRQEEIPLVAKDYERQKQEDVTYHQLARQTLLQTSREKHEADLLTKKRLARVLGDYQHVREMIEGKRRTEMEERRKNAIAQIEREKQKRRVKIAEQREQERLRLEEERRLQEEEEEAARLREEEEERQAEIRRVEQEKQKEMEARKRQEIEERQAKLREQGERQRQREREVEEKLERERAGKTGMGSAGEGAPSLAAWRSSKPAAATEARNASAAPPIIAAAKAGGWRDRLAARGATETNGGDGASPPMRSSSQSHAAPNGAVAPASSSPVPAAAAPTPLAPSTRPPLFGGRTGSGPSWRDKEAARERQGSSGPASGQNTPPVSHSTAQATSQNQDGFTPVKSGQKSYVPPALRNRQQ